MGRGGIAEFPLDSDLKIMNPSQGFRSQLGPRPSHDMVVPKHILNCMASDLDHEEEEEDSKPAPRDRAEGKSIEGRDELGRQSSLVVPFANRSTLLSRYVQIPSQIQNGQSNIQRALFT